MKAPVQAVSGTLQATPSKSVTHRAYLLAAQADRPCTVAGPLRADDPDTTLACLHALGARIEPDRDAVRFLPAPFHPPSAPLDCRNAGTALRLLTAAAARLPVPVAFTGDASLTGRPNGPLLQALASLGARIEGGPTLPFTVCGPIRPGSVGLPAATSSQFATALLLSLPLLPGPSQVLLPAPVASRPYLDVSLDVARRFGLRIEADTTQDGALSFHIPGGDTPHADMFAVEGDWSAAAFPLVAAAVTGGRVTLEGLRGESPQGDRAVLDHLRAFGAHVHAGDGVVRVEGAPLRSPGTVDMGATPDLFPAFAVLAACVQGDTQFTGGAQLRHKESDRIQATARGLAALGVPAQETPDGLRVEGGRTLRPGAVDARGDHRIHMAFRIAALVAPGTTVSDPQSTAVSYPRFEADLARITGGGA